MGNSLSKGAVRLEGINTSKKTIPKSGGTEAPFPEVKKCYTVCSFPPSTKNAPIRKSGDFVDGELHGEGSVVNVLGQTWDGQWRDGEMEGKGRHSAPEAGEFVGDWFRGVLQGKGRIVFKG